MRLMNPVLVILLLLLFCGCKPRPETSPSGAVLTNAPAAAPTVSTDPINVRYIDLQTDETMSASDRSYFTGLRATPGPMFWVTNRGEKPVVVQVSIERLSDGVWVSGSNRVSLAFHPEENSRKVGSASPIRKEMFVLPPHQAAYAIPEYFGRKIPALTVPSTNHWRVKAYVQEQLNSFPRMVAAIKHYPEISKIQGNTNLLAPLGTNVNYFGPVSEVYSDQILPIE